MYTDVTIYQIGMLFCLVLLCLVSSTLDLSRQQLEYNCVSDNELQAVSIPFLNFLVCYLRL
jgi:hypothetical protein